MGWGLLGGIAAAVNPVAAIGTLAAGGGQMISDYMATSAQQQAAREANETNIMLTRETNQFNAEQARLNRDYQTQMSNSAWQRGVADMRAAGINPIMAASQGGASSPSGSTASGSAAHVDPVSASPGAAIAKGIGGLGASALAAAQATKGLESQDAQIQAAKAAALASVAQANNANTSAKATEASMPSIEARAKSAAAVADAEMSEAQYRRVKSGIDAKYAPIDAVTNRVVQGIDGVASAVSIGKMLKSITNMGRDQVMKEEKHLREQGRFGTSLVK